MTFLLGIILVIVGIVTFMKAWQSPSLSIVRAKLTKCELKKNYDAEGSTYEPTVIYQFRIGDRHYIGTKYDFSDVAGSRITTERKIKSLKELVDSEGYIDIYYQTSEPELNVIYPGIHPIHGVRLIFGLVLMIVSSLTLLEITLSS